MGNMPILEEYNDDGGADQLVKALQKVRDTGKKSLVRSTDHQIVLQDDGCSHSSAAKTVLVEEEADDDEAGPSTSVRKTTSSADRNVMTLTSWKTQEFAYRKTSKIGYDDDDSLPTLARGLFTTLSGEGKHRIAVRGYDKFFNEGEMPWTRVRERGLPELSSRLFNVCSLFSVSSLVA
jgi:hypothetical protein